MVPVELSRIIIDERNHDQAVVLREKGGTRQIPIVIGFVEASSIQMKISGVDAPRPLTHDLLAAIIQDLGAEVVSLTIDDIVNGTFFAKLHIVKTAGAMVEVDCRPSDGIALAVRMNIPMFIDEKVFQKAGESDG